MAKAKYIFNVGDEVLFNLKGPSVNTSEPGKVSKVKGRWCWLENNERDWNCYDRNTGLPKESPIPGFVATIRKPKEATKQ